MVEARGRLPRGGGAAQGEGPRRAEAAADCRRAARTAIRHGPRPGIFDYIKEAFKVPYNVILLAGGVLAGVVTHAAARRSGRWSAAAGDRLPPRARAPPALPEPGAGAAAPTAEAAEPRAQAAERLVATLSAVAARSASSSVRERCEELQRSLAATRAAESGLGDIFEDQQAESVNKLLWVFLRTLAYEQMLDDLLRPPCRAQEIEASAAARPSASQAEAGPRRDACKAALAENVEVLKKRLENLGRAEENLRSLRARLVRIENSILLIQEQALTRRDPAFVEAEVKAATVGLDPRSRRCSAAWTSPPLEADAAARRRSSCRREAAREQA